MGHDRERVPSELAEAAGLFSRAPVPVALLSADGSVLVRNESWDRVFGVPMAQRPWEWMEVVASPGRERLRRDLADAIADARSEEIELSAHTRDAGLRDLVVVIAPVDGPPAGAMLLVWDVTERRRNEDRLAFMAGHDALTGLPNRRAFDEALARGVARAARGASIHVLIFDVDRLKAHNDTHGHLAGDQALVNAALLLRRFVRATDLPARIGGDEFAVLLEDSELDEAQTIAERIRSVAAETGLADGGHESGLGVSCGIAALDVSSDARAVMERADAALYAAKAAGRNRVVAWTADAHGSAISERIATVVREGFAHDGFKLVYQPVVNLSDGSVVYFESLVRLQSSSGRVFMPSEFLPVVERLGMMPRLTRRVVELVLWQLALIPSVGVSVNLSGEDLADKQLLRELESQVGSASSAKGRVILEIAEATLLSHLASGREWMETLSAAGCRFVLDDFGTGIGMFVLLREPHVEQVKLSRTITRALSVADGRHAFVKALRELVESQGKKAVATYVETEQLLGEAKDAGFSMGQGFRVGGPESDLAVLVERFGA